MIMNKESAQEIIDYFQKDRMLFYYFKNRYALMLLSYFVEHTEQISRIRKKRFGKLLQKPVIKNILKNAGKGLLTKAIINSMWPHHYECYRLSLTIWGDSDKEERFYNQTSRSGVNLVLQLNFSEKHNREYYKLISPDKDHPFEYSEHPIARKRARTLAWARIDLDLDNNEALIEEIQNDWIREALERKGIAQQAEDGLVYPEKDLEYYKDRIGCHPENLLKYFNEVLAPHIGLWDEAIMKKLIKTKQLTFYLLKF